MIEFVIGAAVVLLAGYFIATHRDRIRQLGAAVTLGAAADSALPHVPSDSETGPHHDSSHPPGPHWDSTDVGGHPDST